MMIEHDDSLDNVVVVRLERRHGLGTAARHLRHDELDVFRQAQARDRAYAPPVTRTQLRAPS